MNRFSYWLILLLIAPLTPVHPTQASDTPQCVYVLKPRVNLRSAPKSSSSIAGNLTQNQSLIQLENSQGWSKIVLVTGQTGWVRDDLISNTTIKILTKERRLLVVRKAETLITTPITIGPKEINTGRYFGVLRDGIIKLNWPNRNDLRQQLQSGKIAYTNYQRALLSRPQADGTEELSLCSENAKNKNCAVLATSNDMKRIAKLTPQGARVEIYASSNMEAEMNGPDAMPHKIHKGALKQLKFPAAGVAHDGRMPYLRYPGGDIQPDFASSSDIVIRSVREAGLDLQAAIYEDMLLNPSRYSNLDLGKNEYGAHRMVPILHAYLSHNSVSLPTDVQEAPYSFEPGDLVTLSTGLTGKNIPDKIGIVGDQYNPAGLPEIITVWDVGQYTREMDILSKENLEVTGHFRFTHLFDYQ